MCILGSSNWEWKLISFVPNKHPQELGWGENYYVPTRLLGGTEHIPLSSGPIHDSRLLHTLNLSFSKNDDITTIHKWIFQWTCLLFMILDHNIQVRRTSFTILQNFKNLTTLYINYYFTTSEFTTVQLQPVRRVLGVLAKPNIIVPKSSPKTAKLWTTVFCFQIFDRCPKVFWRYLQLQPELLFDSNIFVLY